MKLESRNRLYAALLALAVSMPASATTIVSTFDDVADTTPGEDLWRVSFSVSGVAGFSAFSGFDVFFDPTKFGALSAVSAPADWSAFITQPDAGLGADGIYEAQADIDAGAPAEPFVVDVVWLGGGGAGGNRLPFTVFAADPPFEVVERGVTRAADDPVGVPEPGTLILGVGLAALLARRRR